MESIIIDEDFRKLLPPLDKETYRALEENVIANGCMFPLVTWESILIDGYNRYAICTEHGIPFETVEKEFASREDVVIWIISNQVGRRNLTPMQLTYFRGLHYNTAKGKRGNWYGKNQFSEEKSENQTFPKEQVTAQQLSKQYKVSRDTIFNDAKASVAIDAIGKVSPAVKEKILSGDISIDKKELQRLSTASEDEVKTIAVKIEDGTYEKTQKPKKQEEKEKQGDRKQGDSPHISIEIPADPSAISSSIKKKALSPKALEALVISSVSGTQRDELLNTSKTGDAMKVKHALTAYIDTLVDLFRQL